MKYETIPQKIESLKDAISKISDMEFCVWSTQVRGKRYNETRLEAVFARLVFTYYCRLLEIPVKTIGNMLHVNHTTIIYYTKQFNDWAKVDSKFKQFLESVNTELYKVD